jgi:hypothetical protein
MLRETSEPRGKATMGMDVYGQNPSSEKGEYFRNNVWWWRPLWDYCETVAPHLCSEVSGHTNDGEGLDEEGSLELANILREEIENGGALAHQQSYYEYIANLPREDCALCEATGIRRDALGIESGHPERELSVEVQILTGRTHGWCNACDGVGTKESWASHYPFNVENVSQFAEFLSECGGFSIC